MRVDLKTSELDADALRVTVLLTDCSDAQRRALMAYLRPHRRHQLAVLTEQLPQWEQAHFQEDRRRCTELHCDVTLLWDQPVILARCGDAFLWQEPIPNGVIVQAILDRLAWAEQPGEVVLALEQLLLEKELHQQVNGHWPAGSIDQGASDSDTHQML
jgi:hypothetical protein